ncbi:MAG: GNAT family N-acetyltransferase [Phycisphaerales bacterium]|nr:GNAT family N-acetyltransferase [Phycisphaerales bacterium]
MDTRDPSRSRRVPPPSRPTEVRVPGGKGDAGHAAVAVRRAERADLEEVARILMEGAVAGHFPAEELASALAEIDPADSDLDPPTLLWVAEVERAKAGAVGLRRADPHVVAVKWLGVIEAYRRMGIGRLLLEEALLHCQRAGYLKVLLQLQLDRNPVVDLFQSVGFRLHRERERDGRRVIEFYLDLYRDPHL